MLETKHEYLVGSSENVADGVNSYDFVKCSEFEK